MDTDRIMELANSIVKANRNTDKELEDVNRTINEIHKIKEELSERRS